MAPHAYHWLTSVILPCQQDGSHEAQGTTSHNHYCTALPTNMCCEHAADVGFEHA